MPSLRDRIRAIFSRNRQAAEPNTVLETQPPKRPLDLMTKFKAETDRSSMVRKCREMYKTDPRAKKMLRMLARDIVKGGFIVKTQDAKALAVAKDLKKRLDLDKRLDDYVRLTARDGDSFLEVGINDQLEIVLITRKPTLEMHRNSDDYDRFADPDRAYWWSDALYLLTEAPNNAIWFADWQIIHARWEHDEGSRYGSPMMGSGTGHWKKVTEGELDIAVRRKTRAGMKYVHKLPFDADEGAVLAYKENNKEALDNPFAAVADFFGNVEIQAIQGDATLSEIADVEHQIATWFTAGEVPMELVAYGQNLNRDVLGEKKEEYDEALRQLREWAVAEIIKPLLELQWLLAGIYPPNLDYSIEWRTKKEPSAQDVSFIADAALKLRALGVPDQVVAQIMAHFLPDVDPEDLQADAGAEQPEGASATRIDRALTSLGGGL